MLAMFFLIFCAIVASAGLAGWSYYTGAMERVEGGLVRVHVPAGVTYQARDSAKKLTPDVPCADNPAGIIDRCQPLNEGDHVQAVPDAGYGQVASIKLRDQPGWVTFSLDGRYAYPSTGEVIDTKTRKIVVALSDEMKRVVQSEKVVEIVKDAGGHVVRTGDQFGVGRKKSS